MLTMQSFRVGTETPAQQVNIHTHTRRIGAQEWGPDTSTTHADIESRMAKNVYCMKNRQDRVFHEEWSQSVWPNVSINKFIGVLFLGTLYAGAINIFWLLLLLRSKLSCAQWTCGCIHDTYKQCFVTVSSYPKWSNTNSTNSLMLQCCECKFRRGAKLQIPKCVCVYCAQRSYIYLLSAMQSTFLPSAKWSLE